MKKAIMPIVVLLSAATFGTSTAHAAAFEGLAMMRMGAWEVDFSGNVNAFFTNGECDGDAVAGGLACHGQQDYGDVRDGLLPSWLNFSASTTTDTGIRTGVHISFQPGTDTGTAGDLDHALGQGSSNFRQVFLTMGTEEWGTVKLGRDLGVFGSDAILNDMTLLGVGSGAFGAGHTTLGRIGVGYLYADWKAQVQYISPDLNGLKITAAISDPWGAGSLGGLYQGAATAVTTDDVAYSALSGNQEGDTYGCEIKVNHSTAVGPATVDWWAGYISQRVDFKSDLPNGDDDADADGYDIGAKVVFGNFDFVGYYYDGEGIGTTGFLLDGADVRGNERDSDGYYIQGRYRVPTGTLLGFSIGESNLDTSSYDDTLLGGSDAANYNLVESNESWIFGVYHPVGEALNLVVEWTETEAKSHNGKESEEETLAIGAIMFF